MECLIFNTELEKLKHDVRTYEQYLWIVKITFCNTAWNCVREGYTN